MLGAAADGATVPAYGVLLRRERAGRTRKEEAAILVRLATYVGAFVIDTREERVVGRAAALEIRLARNAPPSVRRAASVDIPGPRAAFSIHLTAGGDASSVEATIEAGPVAVVRAGRLALAVHATLTAAVRINCTFHTFAAAAATTCTGQGAVFVDGAARDTCPALAIDGAIHASALRAILEAHGGRLARVTIDAPLTKLSARARQRGVTAITDRRTFDDGAILRLFA